MKLVSGKSVEKEESEEEEEEAEDEDEEEEEEEVEEEVKVKEKEEKKLVSGAAVEKEESEEEEESEGEEKSEEVKQGVDEVDEEEGEEDEKESDVVAEEDTEGDNTQREEIEVNAEQSEDEVTSIEQKVEETEDKMEESGDLQPHVESKQQDNSVESEVPVVVEDSNNGVLQSDNDEESKENIDDIDNSSEADSLPGNQIEVPSLEELSAEAEEENSRTELDKTNASENLVQSVQDGSEEDLFNVGVAEEKGEPPKEEQGSKGSE